MQEIQRFIRLRLSRVLPFHRGGINLIARLSLVTLKPEELSCLQRICHIDPHYGANRRTYAGVIYLFTNPDLGGTAFYRWKAPEIVDHAMDLAPHDPDAALRLFEAHSEVFRQPPRYMTDSNDLADLLSVIPAKFNRLVFYDGEHPHSGYISAPELLTDEFTSGRLTLNFFASVNSKDMTETAL
jgi:hypothetical protein